MKVEIDEGIEMPVNTRKTQYPWNVMEKGDSFAVDKAISTANANKKYAPKKFKCKAYDNAFRVWRIE